MPEISYSSLFLNLIQINTKLSNNYYLGIFGIMLQSRDQDPKLPETTIIPAALIEIHSASISGSESTLLCFQNDHISPILGLCGEQFFSSFAHKFGRSIDITRQLSAHECISRAQRFAF